MNIALNTTPTLDFSQQSKPSAMGFHGVKLPFEIHTLEWMRQYRWPEKQQANKHQHFEIIWVKQGGGLQLIDFEKYVLKTDSIYCIAPGQIHLLRNFHNLQGYVISFSLEFIGMFDNHYELLLNSGIFTTFKESPAIQLAHEMKKEMTELVDKMLNEFDNYFLLRSEILKGYLHIFLIYLARQYKLSTRQQAHSNNIRIVKRFLQLLDKKYASQKMVADYALELCITPNYMNEIVKKVTGMPASEHIKQRIILEAKRQAIYTNASMKEVAYNLGFTDTSHFSKFFKNACGKNFSDFRNEMVIP